MRIVLQRVSEAAVTVDGKITGQIKKGLLILLGIEAKDTDEMLPAYVNKIIKMRIFEDENGKTNLSVTDVCGSLLVVSQFTLCADISHGNRPGFTNAKSPAEAERMYEKFIGLCKEYPLTVERGEFGADMKVSLINDGPFTIIM